MCIRDSLRAVVERSMLAFSPSRGRRGNVVFLCRRRVVSSGSSSTLAWPTARSSMRPAPSCRRHQPGGGS
eukprot:6275389-Pyramimonas_sp.AAC.1